MKAAQLFLALLVVASCSSAFAVPFTNPPEVNYPGWVTDYPYQRNAFIDFLVDPTAGGGIPGVVYSGYDDPVLQGSDFVQISGDLEWIPAIPNVPRAGFIGIDNSAGQTPLTAEMVLHIDNWDDPNLAKHIWLEAVVGGTDPDLFDLSLRGPGGYQVDFDAEDLQPIGMEGGLFWGRANAWGLIQPNPPWEELVMTLDVPPGHVAVVDTAHIATECVPEPGTLVLLGIGVLGLAFCGRRRYN